MTHPPDSLPVHAIVQARIGSTRLPGKTLAEICGKPLLLHVLERVRASRRIAQIVLATTAEPADQVLVTLARQCGHPTYSGSTTDVLDRFYQAASRFGLRVVVRVTADDPFKDPGVIDAVVERFLQGQPLDYASNTLEPTYPEGLDVEVFSFEALERAWHEACLPSDREHVTPYIWRHPDRFRLASVKLDRDLSALRWTLDYEADLEFARAVYQRLYRGQVFGMEDVLALLRAEPHLMKINESIQRNAGYLASLAHDRHGENSHGANQRS